MKAVTSSLDLQGAGDAPLVVLARTDDDRLVGDALSRLGVDVETSSVTRTSIRRPGILVEDGHTSLQLMIVDDAAGTTPVRLLATDAGVLVVADEGTDLDGVVAAMTRSGDPFSAVAAAMAEVGRISEENLEALGERWGGYQDDEAGSIDRHDATRLRARLMVVNTVCAVQSHLTAPDEEFVTAHPDTARLVRTAHTRFRYVRGLSERGYAILGDALDERSAAVSEQLTLVNTVFLPLTLGASFFGMNFAWMTNHATSLPAFVILGILAPMLLSTLTIVVFRRLSR